MSEEMESIRTDKEWALDNAKLYEQSLEEKELLKKQLQAYKDKEDKLREILKYEYSNAILGKFGSRLKNELLQILNEGENNE